jgi:hypothetical protein
MHAAERALRTAEQQYRECLDALIQRQFSAEILKDAQEGK